MGTNKNAICFPALAIAIVLVTLMQSTNGKNQISAVAEPRDSESASKVSSKLWQFATDYFRTLHEKAISDDVEIDHRNADSEATSWHNVRYKTCSLSYIQHANGTRSLVEMSTDDITFALPFGLKLGQTQGLVIEMLGSPNEQNSSMMRFTQSFGDGVTGDVYFNFKEGKLTSVLWRNLPPD